MHHKGLNDEGPRVASPACCSSVGDSYGAEDEELRYGPGIVSKLKNRYLSLAMRESRCRPSLRRFSSLEDLLDTEPREAWQERVGGGGAKPRSAQESAVNRRREVMRRARSVDSLSSRLAEDRAPGLPKSKSASSRLQSSLCALGKDDVIIIETSRPGPAASEQRAINGADRTVDAGEPPPPLTRMLSSSSLAEEEDMPPPDTVRQVKKIFEPAGSRPLRGTAARAAVHKSSKSNGVAPASKPALKAKPAVVPPRKVTPPPAPSGAAVHPFTIEEAKSSLKKVAQVTRPSPRTTLSVRATTLNGDASANSGQDVANAARARRGLTPVTASVTAPLVNGDPGLRQAEGESLSASVVEEGVRRVSDIAVSNIRKESHSQEFNFTSRPANSHGAKPATPKPSSPTPTPLPPSPVASHRVPAHTPFSAKGERAQEESERVHQENLKNAEKSRPQKCTVDSSKTLHPATKVETPIQTKVDYNKPLPKVEFVKVPPPQVEPYKPSPKKAESKSEVVTAVKTEPVKCSPSPSNELQRSSGKGSLVEAFNTNKQPTAGIGGSPGSTPITTKTASHRDRWHQQENTTLVFNFTSSKKETPDYIENDGVDLSKRRPEAKQLESGYVIMPGWEGRMDSSTDGDDLDDLGIDYLDSRPGVLPAPSGIVFEGEAVIINGRSNLQRQPKTRKLTISFDDALTSTYEYPSENSLLEEMGLLPAAASADDPAVDAANTTTPGGLASYTPSKIQIGSTFELGVSRTAPPVQAPPPVPPSQSERVEEEYLRPADETETVTWSAESTSDMLF